MLGIVIALASILGLASLAIVFMTWLERKKAAEDHAERVARTLAEVETKNAAARSKTAGELARIGEQTAARKTLTPENLSGLHERTKKPWPPPRS